MNTAIIGCGLIANMHAQALQAIGQTLYFAIDDNPISTEACANQYGFEHWSSDYQDALSDEIDCVHYVHHPLSIMKCSKLPY